MELQPQPIYRTDGEILSKRLEFTYDSQGRRIEKRVYAYNAATQQHDTLESITRFIYDGWLLIAELTKPADEQLPGGESAGLPLRTYTNGLDLSGTTQGAGGIAGLLFMAHYNPTSHDREGVDAFTYDGNGNVIDLVNIPTPTEVTAGTIPTSGATYEYSPFGQLIRATGTAVDTNPFMFSTKYTDAETGFCYYGYRYYDAAMGRWLNRDPITERGGINIIGMIGNDVINYFDIMGLLAAVCPCKEGQKDISQNINNYVNGIIKQGNKPEEIAQKIQDNIVGGLFSEATPIELKFMADIVTRKVDGNLCMCDLKPKGQIPAAPSIVVCGQCIGLDKIGHFFQQGLTYYRISKALGLGDAYAIAWGELSEGFIPPEMDAAMWDWFNYGDMGDTGVAIGVNTWTKFVDSLRKDGDLDPLGKVRRRIWKRIKQGWDFGRIL